MCDKRVVPLTRLLDGKEICVINGTDELSKEQIEEILQQHSAKIVQNPINTTFCVIVGNNRTVRNIFFCAARYRNSSLNLIIIELKDKLQSANYFFRYEGKK